MYKLGRKYRSVLGRINSHKRSLARWSLVSPLFFVLNPRSLAGPRKISNHGRVKTDIIIPMKLKPVMEIL